MKRLFRLLFVFVVVLFIVPGLAHLAIWSMKDRPSSWRTANWSSAGLLAPTVARAEVYIMAARTGGLKGAISKHSWIVVKKPRGEGYQRYEVVGWGKPVRRNAWAADARWYSNEPEIIYAAKGAKAQRLIPRIEKAIDNYRWRNYGDYTLWPGPNSNTFVASIIQAVPGIDARLPATAVGKDFPPPGKFVDYDSTRSILRLSLYGYAELLLDLRTGIEVNLLGLVAGVDWFAPALKLPGFGKIG